jgi:hypothetical protein
MDRAGLASGGDPSGILVGCLQDDKPWWAGCGGRARLSYRTTSGRFFTTSVHQDDKRAASANGAFFVFAGHLEQSPEIPMISCQ